MKKVVRLSENDLNRLVRRIISEAPFDDSGLPRINVYDDDEEIMNMKLLKRKAAYDKNQEFENSGGIIQMSANDVSFLLRLVGDNPKFSGPFDASRLRTIKSNLESELRQHHTRY